ncbi:hypothetical protein [Rubinisphaera margarita]|uniref:hypothetical protein n=1 Tax=Rubinisphaera margarita TaxID=2909586 RepID=UPI001EE7E5A6|nr:hypothetical protein [Rubinisphaera margarita]MCG6156047.1 hypothetical protein [Rubinisphaera margarita]
MLQFAYYSVMTPEGCAGILWKHVKHADQAALALRLTASDLSDLGIVDAIVPEPIGGAHREPRRMAATLKRELLRGLRIVESIEPQQLTEHRYQRYRRIGAFTESQDEAIPFNGR